MKQIKKVVTRDQFKALKIPRNFGSKIEVIISPFIDQDDFQKKDKSSNFSKLFGIWKSDEIITLESIRKKAWRV